MSTCVVPGLLEQTSKLIGAGFYVLHLLFLSPSVHCSVVI